MLKRDIFQQLEAWRVSRHRKPLLLRGARQVGKTTVLRRFGRDAYEKMFYLNFEEDPRLDDFFSGKLNPEEIIKDLSVHFEQAIRPGKHLIIFDEIQASNRALTALKYFHEQAPEYHVAAAGSLIGVSVSGPGTFPVGQVNLLDMYPMTYLEFLTAMGKPRLREYLENIASLTPLPEPFHEETLRLLKAFLLTGGMPEVVERYRETEDFHEVRRVQQDIINTYMLDFSKHVPVHDIPKIQLIWNSIPSQLGKENKKFIFSALKPSARAREYESSLIWLENAGLIYRIFQVNTANAPLRRYAHTAIFKVFLFDVGLLTAMARVDPKLILRDDILFRGYRGAFTEGYVAQQMRSGLQDKLYYWVSSGGKAEIDFVLEYQDLILPLEAKGGVNPKSKSMRSYREKFSPPLLLRTTPLNLKLDGSIVNIPLYAINLLPRFIELAGKQ